MKEALKLSPQSIKRSALPSPVVLPAGVHCDDRLHAPCMDRIDDAICVIASIGDEGLPGGVPNQRLRFSGVVVLARGDDDVERFAVRRGDRVDLGGKTSSRTAQSIAS